MTIPATQTRRTKRTKTYSQRLTSRLRTASDIASLGAQIRLQVLADCEDARLRELAAAVIRQYDVPEREPAKLARAFQQFAQDRVKFFREWPEFNAAPWVTARWGIGDCDDKARLIAALCKQFRIPVRLRFATFLVPKRGVTSHVWPEVQLGKARKWFALESVKPWPLGKSPLGFIKSKRYKYKTFALEI